MFLYTSQAEQLRGRKEKEERFCLTDGKSMIRWKNMEDFMFCINCGHPALYGEPGDPPRCTNDLCEHYNAEAEKELKEGTHD
jgi:hypothetical protein